VYRNSAESTDLRNARFGEGSKATALSFEFDGHRWAYDHSAFDDEGDYELIWRPKAETDNAEAFTA
jgi:hypothetical protein